MAQKQCVALLQNKTIRFITILAVIVTAMEYYCMAVYDVSILRDFVYSPLAVASMNSRKTLLFLKGGGEDTLDVDVTQTTLATKNSINLKPCKVMPKDLGPIVANKTKLSLESLEDLYPAVQDGGFYAPKSCAAAQNVAVIIPFRDRNEHLAIFLNNIHPFLMKQQLDYGIFIVEQKGNGPFNRAKLFNVGYTEAQNAREGGWHCFIFHDVDLIPLDTRNIYRCPDEHNLVRHFSAAVDKFNFRLPYSAIFGGVSGMTNVQFKTVNGFSNQYWGWGGEDDDMFKRLKQSSFNITRYKQEIAKYTMLHHQKAKVNPTRYAILNKTVVEYKNDGLKNLKYSVVDLDLHHLYTHIVVNID